MFHLRLLGGAMVEDESGDLTGLAARRHPLALLALLATAPSQTLSRGKLSGLLWPESPEERARNRLNTYVHFVRSELIEDVLTSVGDDLHLDRSVLTCDVWQFEEAVSAGDLEQALDLYSGPFLDGFRLRGSRPFEEWVDQHRARLKRGYREALEALAERAEKRGEPEVAAEWWRERANEDPYDSRVALRLMESLAKAGNPAAALQVAGVHRRLLEEEFGTEPSAELLVLVEELQETSAPPAKEPAVVEQVGPAVSATDAASPMPGREPEAGAATETRQRVSARVLTRRNAVIAGAAALALGGVLMGWLAVARQDVEHAPTIAGEGAASARKKLVVLPFENLGPPRDEYFAHGITDAITARLASVSELGVTSRQSAMQYRESGKTTRQIGEELGVHYILEGSVQRELPSDPTSRIRVIPQLVRIADDTHVWAATYDEEMKEVFRVQSEIAERVAQALDVTLLEPERPTVERRPTDDVGAYEYYLRGNDYLSRHYMVAENFRTAVRLYQRAVELDPEFAEAYAGLARAHLFLRFHYSDAEALRKARSALDRALRLGPELPEVQLARAGYLYVGLRDYEAALDQFKRLLDRQPSNAEVIARIGATYRRLGRWEEGTAQIKRALELDPLNYSWANALAVAYRRMRRFEEAERYYDRAIELAPDVAPVLNGRAWLLLSRDGDREAALRVLRDAARRAHPIPLVADDWTLRRIFFDDFRQAIASVRPGERGISPARYHVIQAELASRAGESELARAHYDSARVILEEGVRKRPPKFAPHSGLGIVYAHLGRAEDAVRHGEMAVEILPTSKDAIQGPWRVTALAWVHIILGQHDAAIDRIEQTLAVPSDLTIPLLRVDPIYDPLRDHPRFQALLERGR